ncbi:porin [Acidimangrovimonas pyrenivorans]|uniref:Porin n=1 Tax=Acidimangrovimonas pyrenivorans TaxID=2030798 RepID=A0ABV7ALA6_9RHOB
MKKLLLASAAVVMTAGAAAADNANVNFGGYVRFGAQYNSAPPVGVTGKVTLEKRIRLNIDISKMSDSGIEMGARIRMQGDENAMTAGNGANAYVKANGFTLRVGNIVGAIESMPGLYAADVGLTGLNFDDLVTNVVGANLGTATPYASYWNWDAYSSTGTGSNGVEAIYTAGGFTAHLSHSTLNGVSGDNQTAGFLAYTFGDWTVAVAHQTSDTAGNKKTVLTVGGKLGDFNVGLAGADNDGVKKYTVHGSYTMSALTVNGYIATEDTSGVDTSYGVGAAYDIGGASLIGGVAKQPTGDTRADFGIKFSF